MEDVHSRISLLEGSLDYHEGSPILRQNSDSVVVIRPCRQLLQLLGAWKPRQGRCSFAWLVYIVFIGVIWVSSLSAIIYLPFSQTDFRAQLNIGKILYIVATCLNFMCPLVFTVYYFNRGQYEDLVKRVQEVSEDYHRKLQRVSLWYTVVSVILWGLGAALFICQWIPSFSNRYYNEVYITCVLYTTGWWAIWQSVYGFVCHVHRMEIDLLIDFMKERNSLPSVILLKYQELKKSLVRTQKDFSWIISFALIYHTVDLIIFSFVYLIHGFEEHYAFWNYIGGVLFDTVNIVIKLYFPAVYAAAVRRITVQASERCEMKVTSLSRNLPLEDMQLHQYIRSCESDLGIKILGIKITAKITSTICYVISTNVILSFVVVLTHSHSVVEIYAPIPLMNRSRLKDY